MVRTDNAVGSIVAHVVDEATHVDALHSFVRQYPEEASGTAGMLAHHLPVVIQSGSVSSVIQTVEELRRHEDFRQTHVVLALAVGAVVHGLEAAEVALRMEHGTLLRVVLVELAVQLVVPAFLVTVAPPDDARMVHVALHHFLDQLLTDDGLVLAVPAGELAHHIESERVACLVELRVCRIV